jgi:hypothetical protein
MQTIPNFPSIPASSSTTASTSGKLMALAHTISRIFGCLLVSLKTIAYGDPEHLCSPVGPGGCRAVLGTAARRQTRSVRWPVGSVRRGPGLYVPMFARWNRCGACVSRAGTGSHRTAHRWRNRTPAADSTRSSVYIHLARISVNLLEL